MSPTDKPATLADPASDATSSTEDRAHASSNGHDPASANGQTFKAQVDRLATAATAVAGDVAQRLAPLVKRVRRRSRREKTIGVSIAAVLLLVVVLIFATSGAGATAGESGSPELHRAAVTDFEITVTASGQLEARRQTEIRSQLEGSSTVAEVVEEGTRVKKGDVLVRLNSDQIASEIEEEFLRVESARSDLVSAENTYEIQVSDNESDTDKSQLALELAEIELKQWLDGDVVKRRQQLELAIENGKRRVDQYREKYERAQKLFEQGFVAEDELREDEIRFVESQADLETAQLDKWVYETFEYDKQNKKLTSDVEQARAELDRVQRQNLSKLAQREADRTNRRRQLAVREDKLAKLQRQLEACVMTAPTDGLVVYASSLFNGGGRGFMMGSDDTLQIGKQVHPNELLMVLPDTSEMVAAVRVHEAFAGRIQPGMPATVRIDAVPNASFNGVVASIGVLAESGGWRDPNLREYTVRVNIDADNTEQKLKPSMRSEARLVLGSVEDALSVPIQAVFREGRNSFVYKPRGAKYERVNVQVGRRSSTFAEIASGLKPGDRVLLREPQPGEILRTRGEKPADETEVAEGTPSAGANAGAGRAGAQQAAGAGRPQNAEQMKAAWEKMTPEQRAAMMKNAPKGQNFIAASPEQTAQMQTFKPEPGAATDSDADSAAEGDLIEVTEEEMEAAAIAEEEAAKHAGDSGDSPAPAPQQPTPAPAPK